MSNTSWGRGDPRNSVPQWMWPVIIDDRQRESAPAKPVRIGDAERDEAVSALGDHFAAGRLGREELDERIDQAMQARFSTDLQPLFDDLPATVQQPAQPQPAQWPGQRPPSPLFLLFPLMAIGLVVTAVAIGAPWMLWGLLWFFMLTRFMGRRWGWPQHHDHRPGPPARRL